MNRLPSPPGSGRGLLRAHRAAAAVAIALALAGTPACLLAYGTPETTPASAPPGPTRLAPATVPEQSTAAAVAGEPDLPEGIFHVVQAGQTLWRIARSYGSSVDSIAATNGISDPASLRVGAALFIPGARASVDIAPYPAPIPPLHLPAADQGVAPGGREWSWPLAGEILSRFGDRRKGHTHQGVDIRGRRGEEIVAARAGRVVFAGRGGGGYGLTVVIEHGDAQQSLYAHNESLLVGVGDTVGQGQTIARCGRSGNATTEHVHFEIRRDHAPQDPLPLLGEVLEARR